MLGDRHILFFTRKTVAGQENYLLFYWWWIESWRIKGPRTDSSRWPKALFTRLLLSCLLRTYFSPIIAFKNIKLWSVLALVRRQMVTGIEFHYLRTTYAEMEVNWNTKKRDAPERHENRGFGKLGCFDSRHTDSWLLNIVTELLAASLDCRLCPLWAKSA